MDLVTITDHDSIDGCLELLNCLGDLPDFITGEEVTAFFPEFRHQIHIGVYGITEAEHREIQRLRSSGEELVSYLRQRGILFVLNHFFHNFSNIPLARKYIERMAQLFEVFEIRNGTMQREHNTLIATLLERYCQGARRVGFVGGSDAHTLRRIGRTYTASSARNGQEFLEDIRNGRTEIFGSHANHLSLAAEIYGVVLRYYPTVLSIHNGESPPLTRLKNLFLSILAAPFLVTPYVVAIRHSRLERARMNLFSRLLFGNPATPVPS
jgi:predicted metal-dependent phosphoesterase TrpH